MPRLPTKSTQYIMVVGQIHVPLIKVKFLKRREQFPPREAFGSGVSSLHQHHAHTEGTLSLTWRSAVRARVVSRLFHEIQNALSVLLRRGHCPREINPPVTVLSVAPQAVARAPSSYQVTGERTDPINEGNGQDIPSAARRQKPKESNAEVLD